MEKNKTGKYLKYAIGEIVLVVIGILIALQINNWNESRLTKKKEKVLLEEILSDLTLNENNAQIGLEKTRNIGRDSIENTFKYVIKHLESKSPYNDSLSRHFANIHQVFGIDLKTSGFESLKSSGMDVIQIDSIRSKIGEYYTVTIQSQKDAYNEMRDDFYNYILKFPRTLFITSMDENNIIVQVPINYTLLLENSEYIESLKMYLGIYALDLIKTKRFLNSTRVLKANIKEYLSDN